MNTTSFRRFSSFSHFARLGHLSHFRAAIVLALILPLAAAAQTQPLERITLPPGFTIELLARVPNARQMALSPANILYVGSMREGKVHTHCRSSATTRPAHCVWLPKT